ncbi:MAG: type I 3-dehydroquinate dehydratase [Ruminococcaceae bacterium]|nr:type I 3-dehydroquinate dehydratase [Oscillospiraceae bacterium]
MRWEGRSMNKRTFLKYDKPLLTSMVQADNSDRIKELIDASVKEGAEAIGMQFCKLKTEYRNADTYKELFAYTDLPVYVTNYRDHISNVGKSDDTLADEIVELAECGATLCDVMGDFFDACEGELTMNEEAVEKQMKLITELHNRGAEVLMSSHVFKFTPAERVLQIALEHQRRGADICKIVTGANNMEEQIENLRIINMLKENLQIPFLFLSGGECHIMRRTGGAFGCCMYLCVHEYDEYATKSQPLLREVKIIRDLLN